MTTAEVTDRKRASQAFERGKASLGQVRSALADSGYVGQPFALGMQEILGEHVMVQIAKRNELRTFKAVPSRWAVERSFAWLEKHSRLWKNGERRLHASLQLIHPTFLVLLLKRL